MRTNLQPTDLGDLLDQPLIAVLATRRRDDTVMLSPVWFEWRDGGFNVWAESEANGKVRHLLRDPRASIVVANQEWPYKGIEVRGTATVSGDGFFEVLERTGTRYLGAESGARMVASYAPGVVIRIEPGELRAWDYADEV
ncbi:MAG: TIGR03618 family F420-dependent PPOX class oxidoreductase [Chloroflexi bacterium]|nr:TIGR03618 family F420-dependent PPOX class oxidoreductase [Chloroflexota bacterium]